MSDALGVVHWSNRLTGQTGHGSPIERVAAEAWPMIDHWVEDEPEARLN